MPYAVELYDMAEQDEDEQAWYLTFTRDKLKLYNAMFRRYSAMLPKTQHLTLAQVNSKPKLIDAQALAAFLRDFQVEHSEFLRTEETKRLVVNINKKYERPHEYSH